MEERPIFPKPEDDDEESDGDQPKKKLPSLAELLKDTKDQSKQETVQDIVRAILGEDSSMESDDQQDEIEPNETLEQQGELSEEEVVQINRAIAEEHLANPVTEDIPLPPVTEFLELVVDGVEPDAAYGATKIAHQLDEENQKSNYPIEPEEDSLASETPSILAARAETVPVSTPANIAAGVEAKPRLQVAKPALKPASHTSRPFSTSYAKKEPAMKTESSSTHFESSVAALEAGLTSQEIALQSLSKQKQEKSNLAKNTYSERLQPGLSESRIGLIKPERAEHIGKVLVSKEQSTTEPKDVAISNPEKVKSMRREELLALSSDLNVEGASLKHMFENNLFDESALRRLVEAHFKGQNILPALRREILERQNYFEHDPRLRNRPHSPITSDSNELLNKVLASTDKLVLKELPMAQSSIDSNLAPSKPQKSSVMSVANAVLGVVIAILIGLILFFALR
ncbi:MAG: hypothetical protein ACREF7_02580 [Candidatus Saccharimonadales bacterium]